MRLRRYLRKIELLGQCALQLDGRFLDAFLQGSERSRVAPGDRLGILLSNGIRWCAFFLANLDNLFAVPSAAVTLEVMPILAL